MNLSDFPSSIHPQVAILMGSDSDLPVMSKAFDILRDFEIGADIKILSAHRNPEDLKRYVSEAPEKGVKIFICGAGMAAHLGGVVASLSTFPVIGVPLSSKAFEGVDSLLSMMQMPKGVPVATVAIDGALNAGLLAIQILALADPGLRKKIEAYKEKIAEEGRRKNQ